jgi:hypothetical protein
MSTVHHSISRSSPQCGQRPSHRVSPTSEGLGRSVSERVRRGSGRLADCQNRGFC